jgi:hypothetical protein
VGACVWRLKFILSGEGLDDVSCFLLRVLCVKSKGYVVIVSFFRVFDVICNFVDED